ncbi:MAG: flavin reductase [Bacilli bacterium]
MNNTKILQDISYGMYIVTTKYDNKKVGCIINALTQVTSENPVISINLNKNNYTNKAIKENKTFAVSVLSQNATLKLISNFGYASSKDKDKFINIEYKEKNNLPIVTEKTCGYLICEVINIIDCDTHDVILAKVIDLEKLSNKEPMTYKYYHEVLRGTSPKNAPTYRKEINETKENKYRCKICGYIYDDSKEDIKFEDLPADWKCPLCGAPKSMFEKI